MTAKFGVPPDRIVDYLALVGDAIDNIRVDGVGPGYAAKWIKQYGSLDNLLCIQTKSRERAENLRKIVDWLQARGCSPSARRAAASPFELSEFEMKPDAQRAQYERFGFRAC